MEADDLLCSRNARPQKALVGREQWESTLNGLLHVTTDLVEMVHGTF